MGGEEYMVQEDRVAQNTDAVAEHEDDGQQDDSVSEAPDESGRQADSPALTLEDLKPGMQLKGKVRNVVAFGAFIDIGVGRDGLAHISALQRAEVDKTLRVGDVLEVQIRRVDLENNRISLTIPGAGKESKTSLRDLQAGSTVEGRVVRLVDFGAFVDIGAQTDGLLHISQLSGGYIRHPGEVVRVGDEVAVRILDVDIDKRRISLTMKEVEGAQEEELVPQNDESGERVPSAFASAWEKALENSRHPQSSSRR